MEQLLSEIYEKVVYASDIYNELNQKFDEEVESLIQPLKENISAEELDELRALMYSASFVAEKNGFYMGVHVAVQMLFLALPVLVIGFHRMKIWLSLSQMGVILMN